MATLRAYVRDDLKVIQETAPDVVIGDFRLSLAVSARVARVPYLAITNAYWSPYARRRIPLPELPLTRWFGLRAATALFRLAQPLAFAHHAAALNRVRKEYGLPGLGPDLRRIYTEADHVLYADIPELVPTFDRPAHHHYLGPIQWSIPVATPPWWNELPVDRPSVYVTLGSSGRGSLLSTVLDALASLPVNVLAADPGQAHQAPIPPNARVARYLPGGEAAARSRLVICNGGSPTTHQALAVGTPVLGLAGNMDQHLNMGSVQEYGAGRLVRSDGASPSAIRSAVALMLADPSYSEAASRVAIAFSRYDAPSRLRSLLSQVVGSTPLKVKCDRLQGRKSTFRLLVIVTDQVNLLDSPTSLSRPVMPRAEPSCGARAGSP